MVDSDVMKGLPFNQKRGNDVIHLFQLRWGEGKTGSGFASDQFILFLSIGSLIEMFFQRAFIAGRTAVAYIGLQILLERYAYSEIVGTFILI